MDPVALEDSENGTKMYLAKSIVDGVTAELARFRSQDGLETSDDALAIQKMKSFLLDRLAVDPSLRYAGALFFEIRRDGEVHGHEVACWLW